MRTSLIALGTATAVLAGGSGLLAPSPAAAEAAEAVRIYKTPQCGCCEGHAEHLRENGFEVAVTPTHDLAAMSRMAGISDEMAGCHLALVGGYVVSGHVPAGVVARLLEERPAIKGVTLPGMPMGSPGMGGDKAEPFTIYAIGEGEPQVYAVE